jgi:hypothetical protein
LYIYSKNTNLVLINGNKSYLNIEKVELLNNVYHSVQCLPFK